LRERWATKFFQKYPCPYANCLSFNCPACLKKPMLSNLNKPVKTNLPMPSTNSIVSKTQHCLTKFSKDANAKCQEYVNEIEPLDAISECNATINSIEHTNFNDDIFSCRFRNTENKRIVSNFQISTKDNIEFNALVDTGATISVVSRKFLKTISNSVHKISSIVPFSIILSIESEVDFQVKEQAEICIHINNEKIMWRFYIIDELSNNLVLGMDFLHEYNVVIQCNPFDLKFSRKNSRSSKLSFSSETEYNGTNSYSSAWNSLLSFPNPATKPLNPETSTNSSFDSFCTSLSTTTLYSSTSNKVRVKNRVIIPPMSYHRVPICSLGVDGDVMIIPRNEIQHSLNLLVGKAIVTFTKNESSLYVCNASKRPITLNERTVIGTLEPYEDKNCVFNLDVIENQPTEILASMNSKSFESVNPELVEKLKFGKALTKHEKMRVCSLVNSYSDIFAFRKGDRGATNVITHKIQVDNAMPIKQRAYKQAYNERNETRRITNELLDEGIIQHSFSPWSSPVVLVTKKDGSTRFCIDYRQLNQVTKKDNYPLPRIDDALDRLSGAKYFSSMDCDQAYYQVPVKAEDKEKTAFITPDGLYEFNYMPFGLCNAPATFQRLMDVVLGRLKWTIALVYLDDIVVYSKTFDEHVTNLSQIFRVIREAGLKLKPSKCTFGENKLLYLGHIISENGVTVNPAKIKAVKEFPRPTRKREVMQFLGLCSYYRRFIENFAKIARPLHQLTEDNVRFEWSTLAENAFEKLKTELISANVLAFPDDEAPTQIHCDASGHGLGATLVQIQNGVERVVAYASRSLKKYERNYSATELECLAVIYAVTTFRPHLYGKKFKIITDHCALCYLLNLKDPHGRLARWALRLQPYNFEIVYKSGKKHTDADALSRNPVDKAPPTDNDSSDFANTLCTLSHRNYDNLSELQDADPKLSKIKDALLNEDKDVKFKIDEYSIKNNILYKINNDEDGRLWRICIPAKLRRKIIEDVHVTSAGHLGLLKTWTLIKSRFSWPKMYSHVRRYLVGCSVCQFCNKRGNAVPGPMQLMPPPASAFYRIGIDFQGPYPITKNRNTFIFVIIDHLTRYVEAWPIKHATSEAAIKILEECIIFKHSCPVEIVCDQGSAFTSSAFREFCANYHIKVLQTTAYHPNTNGVCERANGTLKRIIGKYVNDKHKDWDRYVNRAAFSMNIAIHSVTRKSPYFLLYGREPMLPCDTALPTLMSHLDDEPENTMRRATKAVREARIRTIAQQKESKRRFDKKHSAVNFNVGDLVLIANFTRTVGKVSKWLRKWYGPFEIIKVMGPINYIVKDLRANPIKLLRNVSVRHLKLFYEEFRSDSEAEIISETESCDEITCKSYLTSEFLAPSISYGEMSRKSRSIVSKRTLRTMMCENETPNVSESCNEFSDDDQIEPLVSVIEPGSHNDSFVSANNNSESSSSDSDEPAVSELRRSTRTRKAVDRYGDYDYPKKL